MADFFSRVIAKRPFQGILKDARAAGYTVQKTDGGYTVYDGDVMVLRALNGSRGYLTRFNSNYFISSAL